MKNELIVTGLLGLFFWGLTLTVSAQVQQAHGGGLTRVDPPRNVTPIHQLDCNRLVPTAEPWVLQYCRSVDFSMQDNLAHAWGRPLPSPTLLDVPALGTDEARKSGVSCSEGRVIAKVGNAWVQALDSD